MLLQSSSSCCCFCCGHSAAATVTITATTVVVAACDAVSGSSRCHFLNGCCSCHYGRVLVAFNVAGAISAHSSHGFVPFARASAWRLRSSRLLPASCSLVYQTSHYSIRYVGDILQTRQSSVQRRLYIHALTTVFGTNVSSKCQSAQPALYTKSGGQYLKTLRRNCRVRVVDIYHLPHRQTCREMNCVRFVASSSSYGIRSISEAPCIPAVENSW